MQIELVTGFLRKKEKMVGNERNLHDYGWGKISEVSGCYICILDRQLKAGGEGQNRQGELTFFLSTGRSAGF